MRDIIFASIVSFLFGLASKQTAIVLVPLLLLFDYYYVAKNWKTLFSRLKYHLPFLLLTVLLSLVYMHSVTAPEAQRPWTEHVLTELRVIMQYVKLLLVPAGLNIDHDIMPSSFVDGRVALSLAVIVALLIVAVFVRKKVVGISFGIFWYFIALAPFLIIRLNDFMAERWVYSASVGFSLVVAELVMLGVRSYRQTTIVVTGACILMLGALTVMRNDVYASPIRLWEDAVQKSPDKPRPYLNLSRAYIENGDSAQAIHSIQTALLIGRERGLKKKESVAAYINLAAAYGDDYGKAEEALKTIGPSASEYHEYYHNLGLIYMKTGKHAQAIAEFQKALELLPGSPTLLNLIGNEYERLYQDGKARGYFQLAVNGLPQNGVDYASQGDAHQKLGDANKMLACYFEAVNVDPFNIVIRLDLANILLHCRTSGGSMEAV